MKKIQVISRDPYGSNVILQTVNDVGAALKRIKSEVTNLNFENALTTDDRYRAIEAFFPVFVDESGDVDENLVYAGNNTDGRHRVYRFSDDKDPVMETIEDSMTMQMFIGTDNRETVYLINSKKKMVADLKDDLLEGKTYYYIKVVG